MTLEELIRAWFLMDEDLSGCLCTYAEEPAVFLHSAPSDTQQGWKPEGQYPRIVFVTDMEADTERKSQGTLRVGIYCDLAGSPVPEDLEPLVRASLRDVLMKPEGGNPFCFAWRRTDPFEMEGQEGDKRIGGYEVSFDILEYPAQPIGLPDPVLSMGQAMKRIFWQPVIIPYEMEGDYYRTTDERPAVYVRAESISRDHDIYAVSWMLCRLRIHVIAPTAEARSLWIGSIVSWLSRHGEIILNDGHPMLIRSIEAENGIDYLQTGQVMCEGTYAIVSARVDNGKVTETLNHADFSSADGG